ncbi:MAG: molybdenum cofactor biosynthesis protein B [Candidatus Xenobiia bacterium LiM19]
MIKAGVMVISDGCFHGREDKSGPVIEESLKKKGIEISRKITVPDERSDIAEALTDMADNEKLDLVITTGGTGFSPRDVTPEATGDILDRDVPGIPIALITEGLKNTPRAMLSRGRAGIRKHCLIINLPGSPRAVEEGMAVLIPILEHAFHMMKGEGHPSIEKDLS